MDSIIEFDTIEEMMKYLEENRRLAGESMAFLTPEQKKIKPGSCYRRFHADYGINIYGYLFTVEEQALNEIRYSGTGDPPVDEDWVRNRAVDDAKIGMFFTLSFSNATAPWTELGSVHVSNMDAPISKQECMDRARELGCENDLIRWLGAAYDDSWKELE